jgi:hypothetical protein
MAGIGVGGTVFQLRGIGRQMGGYYNWKYNVVTGPPFPAPVQVALFGLVAALASAPPWRGETPHLLRWVRVVDALSYVALAIEAGYNHWMGGYFNKVMYVPIVLSPLLTLTHLAALVRVGRHAPPRAALGRGDGVRRGGLRLPRVEHRPSQRRVQLAERLLRAAGGGAAAIDRSGRAGPSGRRLR